MCFVSADGRCLIVSRRGSLIFGFEVATQHQTHILRVSAEGIANTSSRSEICSRIRGQRWERFKVEVLAFRVQGVGNSTGGVGSPPTREQSRMSFPQVYG